MSKLILYHGSSEIIEKPIFGKGKAYNDYGRGFYCTENFELARSGPAQKESMGMRISMK